MSMPPRILVPLAPGFEEIEAVTVIDLLRRAGCQVTTAGLSLGPVRGAHGICLLADEHLESVFDWHQDFDALVLPGGMPGSDHLRDDPLIIDLVRKLALSGRLVAAICAAPKVLVKAGVLEGRRATAYPGVLEACAAPGVQLSEEAVVEDGNLLTARGPGVAQDFALALVARLCGEGVRAQVEAGLQRR